MAPGLRTANRVESEMVKESEIKRGIEKSMNKSEGR